MPHTSQLLSLIASLPMLKMQAPPGVSREKFLLDASAWLSPEDLKALTALSLLPDGKTKFAEHSFAAKYTRWETALRHSLVRLRLAKKHRDGNSAGPARDNTFECDADAAAVRAFAASNPLEREKLLDQARWEKTEELTARRIFDLDILQAYFIRLQIAEKWAARAAGNAEKNLNLAAQAVREQKP